MESKIKIVKIATREKMFEFEKEILKHRFATLIVAHEKEDERKIEEGGPWWGFIAVNLFEKENKVTSIFWHCGENFVKQKKMEQQELGKNIADCEPENFMELFGKEVVLA